MPYSAMATKPCVKEANDALHQGEPITKAMIQSWCDNCRAMWRAFFNLDMADPKMLMVRHPCLRTDD